MDALFKSGYITPVTAVSGSNNISQACAAASETYKIAAKGQDAWALKMLDSNSLVPGPGILEGNSIHLPGSMHSCFQADSPSPDLRPRFWLFTTWKENATDILGLGITRIGRCLPAACTEADLVSAVGAFLDQAGNLTKPKFSGYTARVLDSHGPSDNMEWSTGDMVMLVLVGLMGGLVIISTLLDLMATEMEMAYFDVPALGVIQVELLT